MQNHEHVLDKILVRLFRIIFDRYRRKLGTKSIESAWYQASSKVTGYMSSAIAAIELVIVMVLYNPLIKGSAFDSKRVIVFVGTAGFLITAYLLGQRFRRFLTDPPSLASVEGGSDTRFIFWFRFISSGIFVLVCLGAFALHKAGFPLIK